MNQSALIKTVAKYYSISKKQLHVYGLTGIDDGTCQGSTGSRKLLS